jgi:molybdenum cofactor sulfurtransferase
MKVFHKIKSVFNHSETNTDLDKDYQESYFEFKNLYPEYNTTLALDELRKKEFGQLEQEALTYLDFASSNLYAPSQVQNHVRLLNEQLLSNPASNTPTGKRSRQLIEESREYLLNYFNTSSKEYLCIFTQNATEAIKLVAENYPFEAGDHLLMSLDNHRAVSSIFEKALQKEASLNFTPVNHTDLRLNERMLIDHLDQLVYGKNKLFVFPAQSNLSGVKHGLEWVNISRSKGWNVLLDGTAYLAGSQLDLQQYPADFVSMSFYKIFGYPSGLGALLISRSAFDKLLRPWNANTHHQSKSSSLQEDATLFESGSLNYQQIPAIPLGLKWLQNIGQEIIEKRIETLTSWMLDSLQSLRHTNGKRVVKLYGPKNTTKRGGTICFNFLSPEGELYQAEKTEALAARFNICLKAAGHSNPGTLKIAHSTNEEELYPYYNKQSQKNALDLFGEAASDQNALRISLGYISDFKDVYRFFVFCKRFIDKQATGIEQKISASVNA